MPPAPPVISATRPASDFGFGMRCSLASSSSQYSMSKASCSLKPDIGADAGGAAHDVDRVDVELAGDARGRLVLGEGDHADARDQIDHRVGIAHRRRIAVFAAIVVGGVVARDRRRARRRAPTASASCWVKAARAGGFLCAGKWSGHDVPSAASGCKSRELTNSSTSGASVKWPTLRSAAEMRARIAGMSRAAISRRRSAGSGSTTAPPKAGASPLAASHATAWLMTRIVVS